jgi:hypothetical protein
MINIAIHNEQNVTLAQQLGQHKDLQETVEKALSLYLQHLQQQKNPTKQRTVGEYVGKIVIHDDFDAPLGDDFWLGGQG